MRRTYPTDLYDAEWTCLKDHLPVSKVRGRPTGPPPTRALDKAALHELLLDLRLVIVAVDVDHGVLRARDDLNVFVLIAEGNARRTVLNYAALSSYGVRNLDVAFLDL